MEYKEAIAKIEQVGRERASLEAFYADLQQEMIAVAEARQAQGPDGQSVPPEVAALLTKVTTAMETERQQVVMLWELLIDAHMRLAESYDFELPPGFPKPG